MKVTPYALTYAPNFKWAALDVPDSEGKAWIKILGKDPENGATAALVRYDAGFRQLAGVGGASSDSIVIDGLLRYGEEDCRRLAYWYRPTGAERPAMEALENTTRFVITSGRGESTSPDAVFMENVERGEPDWITSERGSAWSEKTLRVDEQEGSLIAYQFATMFTMFMPGKKWVHPDIEEAYCIEGEGWDYVGEVETFVKLLPGTYIYRPPNETFHGTATTVKVPRRLFVKYYNANLDDKFRRSIEEDIEPASINE